MSGYELNWHDPIKGYQIIGCSRKGGRIVIEPPMNRY